MSVLTEVMMTYYDKKWAERYGVAPEDVKDALKMIGEVVEETDYDYNDVLATYLY